MASTKEFDKAFEAHVSMTPAQEYAKQLRANIMPGVTHGYGDWDIVDAFDAGRESMRRDVETIISSGRHLVGGKR